MKNRFSYNLILIGAFSLAFSLHACKTDEEPSGPAPVITSFSLASALPGTTVAIFGNHFIPEVAAPAGPLENTSRVAFNGVPALAERVYQDSAGRQRIHAVVPDGAATGRISVTANGITTESIDNFIISEPKYEPGIIVSTVAAGMRPRGIAIDKDGNRFLTSWDHFNILKMTPSGSIDTLLSTFHDPDREPVNLGIAVASNGNVYASVGHTIRKIEPDGTISVLAGSDAGYADGQGTDARFFFPFGLAIDLNGDLIVADGFNFRIRKVTPDGTVSTLAGGERGYVDGPASIARFMGAQGVAVGSDGSIYMTEGGNRVRKLSPDGMVSTVAGSETGFLDGNGLSAHFFDPVGIAVDARDNLFVADRSNAAVRKITPSGDVTTMAGGRFGFADGPGPNAQFTFVMGIALDTNGALLVTDEDNGRVRKIE